MKVKIKSVLKTSSHDFQCFEDQQIMFPSGNTLCIKQMGKNQTQFICLSQYVQQLFSFKPSTNKKGVFTAQKLENTVEVAYYNLKGERKNVNLTQQSSFFNQVQKIELLVDEYDNNLVYGAAKNKEGACIFLCDISKSKVLAQGFMPHFQDVKVDSRQNMTLSLCGFNGSYNYLKYLRYGLGQWQIEQIPYKKISAHHGHVIYHEILFGGRLLFATKTSIYLFEDTQLIQTFQLTQNNKIHSILKIPKAFLVLLEDQTVKVYIQDSDEINFFEKGQIRINLDADDFVHKMQINFNNQQVVIRTVKNNIYAWKTQHTGLDSGHSQMVFAKLESSCVGQKTGSISISTGKRYCMLSESKVITLWSLQKNQTVLSSEFLMTQSKGKNILASAISPDGNSFILSFEDKIRIYKILLTKFKLYAQFTIKRCQNIIYSHGGQLVACKYGKGSNSCLQIINLLRLCQVHTIKILSEPIHIEWNQLDDQIVIAAENQTVQIFKVSQNTQLYNLRFDTPVSHARYDYRIRRILVSTGNRILAVEGGKIVQEIIVPIQKFHYVFPLYGFYLIVTKSGTLYVSPTLKFQSYTHYSLFPQKSFNLICRNSYLVAYSSFQDVLILECIRQNYQKRASQNDIVMVQRDQVLSLFDKVKLLQGNFDMLLSSTQVKLEDQKNNYEAAINKFKAQFAQQIKFLNSKFADLSMKNLQQEKDNERFFQTVETGQIKSVNELERMFNRKLNLEKEKYLNLQQKFMEQKINFSKILCEVESKYHKQVSQVRENYGKKLKEESQRADQIKKNNLQDKQRIQMKLLDLQQENQVILTNVQQNKDFIIFQLQQKIKQLAGQYDTLLIKHQNQGDRLKEIEDERESRQIDFRKLNLTLTEHTNRIQLLEKELANKIKVVEEKNQDINELTHQIGGLEKAKYVLSFRTTQIRKQLEPKETLIDNLKSELFKLDDQYKQEKKKVFELSQKIEKLQVINQTTKKENIQIKSLLKQKQRIHDQLCFQIFMVINTIDQKEWNNSFIKIYQSYIKEEKFKNRQTRKKDHTSEEINRHLIHVQQSLYQISSGNNKSLKRKEQEITKKMEENSLLIYELNVMRKNQKNFDKEKKQMGLVVEKLKKQLNDSNKSSNVISTRANTAKTAMTKRISVSRDAMSRGKSTLLDINEIEVSNKEKTQQSRDGKSRNKARSRISSANKTMIMRNDNRDQMNKFFQIAKDLQTCRNTIKIQDELIQQLNQRLLANQQT